MSERKLTEQARAKLDQYAPTAGVAIVAAAIAARLAIPDAPDMKPLPPLPAEAQQAKEQPRRRAVERDITTRLVSCGDSTAAMVTGDDLVGVVELGAGASGRCTVLFASRWERQPLCVVEGGTIEALDETDMIVTGAEDSFSYRCDVRGADVPESKRPLRPDAAVDEQGAPDERAPRGSGL